VPDPYYGGEQGFDEVLAQIDAACTGVVDALRAGRLEP
jgi:protein-tyrosine phosphatase